VSAAVSIDAPLPANGQRKRSRRRFWDQVSIYLPVLLMGLLALASYWLLRATPEAPEPVVARPLSHQPDYFMRRFSVKVFDASGVLKTEVFGAEARHHPDTDTVEIDNARIRSFNAQGQLSTATARRVIANGNNTEFTLEGDAVVIREAGRLPGGDLLPRLEFRGESLQVFTDPERIVSTQPVLLVRGNDRMSASALDYRGGDERVAVFSGRVRSQLAAR
jgi:lipopolysaccharide export system protein LptC